MNMQATTHANLGKDFEADLERTHHMYAIQKRASIERNPEEWRYTSAGQYAKLAQKAPTITAKTANGLYLVKVRSDVDYSGVAMGRAVAFDAKQIQGKSFPLGNLSEGQLRKLMAMDAAGAIAGIMIRFTDAGGRVFFVPAKVLDDVTIKMLYHGGRKSLALADCEERGIEIPTSRNLIDWLPTITRP